MRVQEVTKIIRILLGALSNQLIHPLTRKRVLLPPLDPGGETKYLVGEGVGRPISDDGTDTLVLVNYNPSTCQCHLLKWEVQLRRKLYFSDTFL
jgi:hypothetical protein